MTDEFIRQGLTTSVAQICSNIGWNSISSSTLQIMTDILYEYFKNMAQSVKKFSEISNAIEPNIDDINMAFQDKNVDISDLINYLKQVGCIEFPHQIPKFPIPTNSNLNIMKPGSREIVTRPVCIHENLPSIYPKKGDEKTCEINESLNQLLQHTSPIFKMINDPLCLQKSQDSKNNGHPKHNIHRRLREITSVVMTTSGFLSPSREGKLPESRLLPFSNLKKNQTSYPNVPSEVKNELNHYEHNKKLLQKSSIMKYNNNSENSKINNKSKLSLLNIIFDKPVQELSKHSKTLLDDNEKLITKPHKEKLKFLKQMSKTSNASGHLDKNSVISKLTSTIVSSSALFKSETKPEVIEKIPLQKELVKPFMEKTFESVTKPSIQKTELNPKKRKKKEKILTDDINSLKQINTGTKKLKNKYIHDLYSPLKFSFFGNVPNGTSILPPLLAKNPLVPNYDNLSKVLPRLEKSNTVTSKTYLPIPEEDNLDTFDLHKPSSSIIPEEKLPEKMKAKKDRKKKDKIKSKKKKIKNNNGMSVKEKKKKEKKIQKSKNKSKFEEKKTPTIEDLLVPKIKLKLPSSNNTNSSTLPHEIVLKPLEKNKSPPVCIDGVSKKKVPVSEFKTLNKDTLLMAVSNKEDIITSLPENKEIKLKKQNKKPISSNIVNHDVALSIKNNSISKNVEKKTTSKKLKKIQENRQAFYFDEIGNQIWICPTCSAPDDGSPMIGCDFCDAWYHWVCVGIQCPPDCAVWYCTTCQLKLAEPKVTTSSQKAKKGRPLKKKSIS